MSTHTPAQAIQELVNHTAVLTERLVGLQTEVRKGMASTPELGNALTQVVGDTKRMLQAIEHLARLPAFHLDREGLNAAVAAGVQQGLTGEGGSSLAALIESNSRHLEEARGELVESKRRMDKMLEEIQSTKAMSPEGRKELFKQIVPVVAVWSIAMMFVGILVGAWIGGGETPPRPPASPPSLSQSQRPSPALPSPSIVKGAQIVLSGPTPLFVSPGQAGGPAFTATAGSRLVVIDSRPDGWIQVGFKTGPNQTATAWVQNNALK